MTGLSAQTHTLAVEVAGSRNPNSQANWIWLDAFDYTPGGTPSNEGGLPESGNGGDPAGRSWSGTVAVFVVILVFLSLGDRVTVGGVDAGPGPYGLLYDFVPGFKLVRIPERLGLYVLLGVGLLGALTLDRCIRSGRTGLALGLAGIAVLEHFSPLVLTTDLPRPRELPPVYQWLATQPAEPVVELPVRGESLIRQETIEMFFASYHRQREPLGYTAYPTLLSKVVRRALLDFPSDTSLTVLDRIGVHRVIVHDGREIAADLRDQIFNFGPPDREARFAEALRVSGQDVYANLSALDGGGRLSREIQFGSWKGGSLSGAGESV